MKCTVCRGPAVIDLRRHNAHFCVAHLQRFCRDQVAKAIDSFDMIQPEDRVLVAVSGGKDSLAAWEMLVGLGYHADGLYVGLGIGSYSDRSAEHARRFATQRNLVLHEVDLPDRYGFDIPTGARTAGRVPCSACGLSKRHVFDRVAVEGGYDALVTGHNLDDEAAVLFGNVLNWQTDYLARQWPVLEAGAGFPRKVKPLVRLTEREVAAYCVVSGIDYIVEECPMASGNRHLGYKELLNQLEESSPGAKANFLLGYFRQGAAAFRSEPDDAGPQRCSSCGAPSSSDPCAFCRLVARAGGRIPRHDDPDTAAVEG